MRVERWRTSSTTSPCRYPVCFSRYLASVQQDIEAQRQRLHELQSAHLQEMAATAAAATAVPAAAAPAPGPVPADPLPATSAQPTPVSSPGRQDIDTPAVWSRGGPVGAGTAGSRRSSIASSQPLTPRSAGGQGSEAGHFPGGHSSGGVASPQVARTFAALRHSARPVRVAHDRSLLQQSGVCVCACECASVCVYLSVLACKLEHPPMSFFTGYCCSLAPRCRTHWICIYARIRRALWVNRHMSPRLLFVGMQRGPSPSQPECRIGTPSSVPLCSL